MVSVFFSGHHIFSTFWQVEGGQRASERTIKTVAASSFTPPSLFFPPLSVLFSRQLSPIYQHRRFITKVGGTCEGCVLAEGLHEEKKMLEVCLLRA
jgi:hypothetical protein